MLTALIALEGCAELFNQPSLTIRQIERHPGFPWHDFVQLSKHSQERPPDELDVAVLDLPLII
jgi:hypothetical protein